MQHVHVCGPLGPTKPLVETQYTLDDSTAIIEMASICGLMMVPPELRNPFNTTTAGVGEVILHAYSNKARKFLLGIGGTATNDAGLGALERLGVKMLVRDSITGEVEEPRTIYGRHLIDLVDMEQCVNSELYSILNDPEVTIHIACDVQNPFIGPEGAVNVFSAQKGASADDRVLLERGMENVAAILEKKTGVNVRTIPGCGAAGGIAAAFLAFFGPEKVKLKRGIHIIAENVGLEKAIAEADIVFSGEGSYDAQTEQGKVVSLVSELCQKHHKKLVILCGRTDAHVDLGSKNPLVLDLMAHFGEDRSMHDTENALQELVKNRIDDILSPIS